MIFVFNFVIVVIIVNNTSRVSCIFRLDPVLVSSFDIGEVEIVVVSTVFPPLTYPIVFSTSFDGPVTISLINPFNHDDTSVFIDELV